MKSAPEGAARRLPSRWSAAGRLWRQAFRLVRPCLRCRPCGDSKAGPRRQLRTCQIRRSRAERYSDPTSARPCRPSRHAKPTMPRPAHTSTPIHAVRSPRANHNAMPSPNEATNHNGSWPRSASRKVSSRWPRAAYRAGAKSRCAVPATRLYVRGARPVHRPRQTEESVSERKPENPWS